MTDKSTIVKEFLTLVASGYVQEWFDRYVHDDFIHHNQYFPGDRQSLLDAMRDAHRDHPNKSYVISQCIEQWDRVMVYGKVEKELMNIAVVHICKVVDWKIEEMRDVWVVIDPDSPNMNWMF